METRHDYALEPGRHRVPVNRPAIDHMFTDRRLIHAALALRFPEIRRRLYAAIGHRPGAARDLDALMAFRIYKSDLFINHFRGLVAPRHELFQIRLELGAVEVGLFLK